MGGGRGSGLFPEGGGGTEGHTGHWRSEESRASLSCGTSSPRPASSPRTRAAPCACQQPPHTGQDGRTPRGAPSCSPAVFAPTPGRASILISGPGAQGGGSSRACAAPGVLSQRMKEGTIAPALGVKSAARLGLILSAFARSLPLPEHLPIWPPAPEAPTSATPWLRLCPLLGSLSPETQPCSPLPQRSSHGRHPGRRGE